MPETHTTPATHRLVDIVVEEVSLVDRAANQHRFLVVKRSDPMADNANTTRAEPSTGETDVTDLAALPDEPVDFGRDDATASADGAKPGTDARADALLSALETLTSAVEQLDAEGGSADFDALAAELRTIAETLSPSPDKNTPPGAKPESANPEKTDGAKEHLTAVKEALARLKEVASTSGAKPGAASAAAAPASTTPASTTPASTTPASTTPASTTPASTTSPAAPATDSKLQAAVESLTAAVREQNQRLSVVEKQFGLPNSTPVGDRPVTKAAEVSWPVDLNRPLDRDSVEKAVSFHEP